MRSLLLLVAGGLLSALSVAAAEPPDEVSLSSLVARMDSMQEQLDEQKHEIAVLRDNENGQQVTEEARPTTTNNNETRQQVPEKVQPRATTINTDLAQMKPRVPAPRPEQSSPPPPNGWWRHKPVPHWRIQQPGSVSNHS